MAILDTLTIQLAMDGTGLTKGVKEAEANLKKVHESVGKSTDTLVDAGKKGADTFASFRREAMGALALFTGGASIAGFTKDIAGANTALGALSRQLDIAPQKLYQMHEAMKATGGSAGSVDSFLTGIRDKAATKDGIPKLTFLGNQLGVQFFDANNKVRADIIDQLAHSKRAHSLNRGVLDNYIQQAGGNADIANLAMRSDYDRLTRRFAHMGPTPDQIKKGEQLLADWEELKANTDQVMLQVFSDLEPSVHNFLQAMIALEKAHPREIAEGVSALAKALMVLSLLLTARSFLSFLGTLAGIGGGAAGAAMRPGILTGAGMVGLFASSPVDPDDQQAINNGYAYEALVEHYKRRTGSLTVWGFDEAKERALVQQEDTGATGDASYPNNPNNIDLDRLTGAVAMSESGGDPNAVSDKGAEGMMQFMPGTARAQGVTNPFDPNQAWNGGRRYLNQLIGRFHDVRKAIAAYNMGEGALGNDIRRYGNDWDKHLYHQTANYLVDVLRNYETGHIVRRNADGTFSTTTNNSTINVNINGSYHDPEQIRRAARRGVEESIRRSQNASTG